MRTTAHFPLGSAPPRHGSLGLLFLCLLLAVCSSQILASADWELEFEEANRLYEQGQFNQAIAQYQALSQGQVSPELLFNLGNAHYRNGQKGWAIYYYRMALDLAPRDRDTRENLRFVREQVEQGFVSGSGGWRRLARVMTLNELSLLAMAAGWVLLGFLTAGNLKKDWRETSRSGAILTGILFGASALWLGTALLDRATSPDAVVIAPNVEVRYGPLEESKPFFSLNDGAEITKLDHRNLWVQVQDRHGRSGWLPRAKVALINWNELPSQLESFHPSRQNGG
jgi:tetratricopeptide (TPR) repeat protein